MWGSPNSATTKIAMTFCMNIQKTERTICQDLMTPDLSCSASDTWTTLWSMTRHLENIWSQFHQIWCGYLWPLKISKRNKQIGMKFTDSTLMVFVFWTLQEPPLHNSQAKLSNMHISYQTGKLPFSKWKINHWCYWSRRFSRNVTRIFYILAQLV